MFKTILIHNWSILVITDHRFLQKLWKSYDQYWVNIDHRYLYFVHVGTIYQHCISIASIMSNNFFLCNIASSLIMTYDWLWHICHHFINHFSSMINIDFESTSKNHRWSSMIFKNHIWSYMTKKPMIITFAIMRQYCAIMRQYWSIMISIESYMTMVRVLLLCCQILFVVLLISPANYAILSVLVVFYRECVLAF